MSIGLVGKKCGMMRIFHEDGYSVPVTVLVVKPNRITQVKTFDNDGYQAVQMTFGEKVPSRLTRAQRYHFAKANTVPGCGLWEFKLDVISETIKVGTEITVDIFTKIQYVDVVGLTKGKGFAGCIKRHNFSGQRNTHGNSRAHRVPGSIGQNQTPGRVFKGKKMAGQMGNKRCTVQTLKVERIDQLRHLLLVKGAVPGARDGYVLIKPAVKKKNHQVERDTDK